VAPVRPKVTWPWPISAIVLCLGGNEYIQSRDQYIDVRLAHRFDRMGSLSAAPGQAVVQFRRHENEFPPTAPGYADRALVSGFGNFAGFVAQFTRSTQADKKTRQSLAGPNAVYVTIIRDGRTCGGHCVRRNLLDQLW
jgi:hypothetical protein